ncbi:thioredoxin family protein [Candidatus Venteria ishoeyi]|uniref:Thioredoxin-like fold domain-containing protein n=1 Tax=Candidatus Venteria ishoeyi TaxID=1899563 RepID=A0A1H6FF40_9GAMM|nr:thioredoxin family protein [Candidatus Venteria ishoeyi]SEH07624.1 Uncharacterised protein [Candidatus Venteria ishoeyi]
MGSLVLHFHQVFIFITPVDVIAKEDAYSQFFDQSWGNLPEELGNAREAGKQGLILFFEMDECPFCARMRETFFTRKDVQDYFKPRFLILPIDIEGDTELVDFTAKETTAKAFSQKNKVRATPVIIFYDLEGKQLYRHTGPTKDAQEFIWMGQYIATGAYKNKQRFSQYRRAQRAKK